MHGYRIPRFGIKFSYVSYKKRLPRKRLSLKVSYENKMQLYYHDVIITQWRHHGVKTSSWRYDVIMNLWGHHDLMTSSWLYEFMTSSWPYDIIMKFWRHVNVIVTPSWCYDVMSPWVLLFWILTSTSSPTTEYAGDDCSAGSIIFNLFFYGYFSGSIWAEVCICVCLCVP